MTIAPLKVAVLISAGQNPKSGSARACRGDAVALAFARSLACEGVHVYHVGRLCEAALDDYLAYGAGSISVIESAGDVASAILPHILSSDLVITGMRAETGLQSGLVPYLVAEQTGRAIVANAIEAERTTFGLRVTQTLPKGHRRKIDVGLPAVIAVHPGASVTLRYAFAQVRSGVKTSVKVAPRTPTCKNVSWSVEPRPRAPTKLKAESGESGFTRLQSFISSPGKRGLVALEGTSVDKAQTVLNYLRDHKLIDL